MSAQDTVFSQKTERIFSPGGEVILMGILNITPDSFFDGGRYESEEQWLQRAGTIISEGADIIDLGAASTRPGSKGISEEEELKRAIPAIRSIRSQFPEILISIDTYRSKVAAEAVKAGANIINDISGGTLDKEMFSTIAQLQVPYILMHIQGTPETMQLAPEYADVVKEVDLYFSEKIRQLDEMGFRKIVLDPGFGFGKNLEHNFRLLAGLGTFQRHGLPVMAGLSRKSMINKLLNVSSKDALNGTNIVNTIALANGARLLRVHDVKEAREAIRIHEYMKGLQPPAGTTEVDSAFIY